jgi:regulator of ribonuclease activity A
MGQWNTCDLYDLNENSVQTCALPLRHFGGKNSFCGQIETVSCWEDNTLAKELLSQDGKGKVLVIDGQGSLACALLGDLMAALGQRNNWQGVVINGMVRDSRELCKLSFGVMALGTNPKKSRKDGNGAISIPLFFGSTIFKPGKYIYCDYDGIILAEKKIH